MPTRANFPRGLIFGKFEGSKFLLKKEIGINAKKEWQKKITRYERKDLEVIFDSVKEIERHSGMIADRIRTDYFSDDDYEFQIDLKVIEVEFEKIKKYLSSETTEVISVAEKNKNFVEFMSYIASKK